MEALQATVENVLIGFQNYSGAYTADLVLLLRDGSKRHVDCRVSDAAALVDGNVVACSRTTVIEAGKPPQ